MTLTNGTNLNYQCLKCLLPSSRPLALKTKPKKERLPWIPLFERNSKFGRFWETLPSHLAMLQVKVLQDVLAGKVNHLLQKILTSISNFQCSTPPSTLQAQHSNQIYAFSSSICSVGVGISVGTWDVRWRVKRELEPPQERQKNVVTAKIRKKKLSTNKGPATKKDKSPSKSSWIGGMLVGLTVIAPKIQTPTFPDCLCIGLIRLDLPNQVEVQCCFKKQTKNCTCFWTGPKPEHPGVSWFYTFPLWASSPQVQASALARNLPIRRRGVNPIEQGPLFFLGWTSRRNPNESTLAKALSMQRWQPWLKSDNPGCGSIQRWTMKNGSKKLRWKLP